MSQMRQCPTCSNDLAPNAASCPKCGHVLRAAGGINTSDPVHMVGLVLVAIFVLGVIIAGVSAGGGC